VRNRFHGFCHDDGHAYARRQGWPSQESNYWQESLKQHEKTYIGFNLHAPLAVAGHAGGRAGQGIYKGPNKGALGELLKVLSGELNYLRFNHRIFIRSDAVPGSKALKFDKRN
jgi:hypothetical protein